MTFIRYTYKEGILADLDGKAVMVPDQIASCHIDDAVLHAPFLAAFAENREFFVKAVGFAVPVMECDMPDLTIDETRKGDSVLVEYTPEGLEEFWHGSGIPCLKEVVPLYSETLSA